MSEGTKDFMTASDDMIRKALRTEKEELEFLQSLVDKGLVKKPKE